MESDVFAALKVMLALAFVIGLFLLCVAMFKKAGLDKKLASIGGVSKRLSIIQTMYLDPKRRLVLVKCDEKEHLLLLGPSGDLLVESQPFKETPDGKK